MPISFEPLKAQLEKAGIPRSRLKTEKVLGGGSYTAIASALNGDVGDGITVGTINAICRYLHCQPGDIMSYVEDENEGGQP